MFDVIIDSLIDTLKVFPFLFVIYIILEILENNKKIRIKTRKMLNGKYSPLIGTAIGVIPQCGFSVITTKLYCERFINIGTLIAVYIATSDEALPILLSNPDSFNKILPLFITKIIFALFMGYSFYFISNYIKIKKSYSSKNTIEETKNDDVNQDNNSKASIDVNKNADTNINNVVNNDNSEEIQNIHNVYEHFKNECSCSHCRTNTLKENSDNKKFDKKEFFTTYGLHPLIHSLKVLIYILIVNLIIGTIIYYIGEANLNAFILKSKFFQPAITALIGLIPNCASSVIITQLYVLDSLNLGATVAGLSVNAGIGYVILFKHNKNIKQNLFIILILYTASVILGTAIMLLS